MILYRTGRGPAVEVDGRLYRLAATDWDSLINRDDLSETLTRRVTDGRPGPETTLADIADLRAPIGSQEVWAAGVSYVRRTFTTRSRP